ncbi:MAG: heme NO-binding domain-containing protein [Pseudomonadota bacterium]
MKGIIFNVVEDVVAIEWGPSVWDKLLSQAGLDGAYTSLGSYPDEQFSRLISAASELMGDSKARLLLRIGRLAIPKLYKRFPKFFDQAANLRSFVLSINTIIHPEVHKLYTGAGCPHFHFVETENTVTLGYNSPRKLCYLAQGFILGLADYYDETISVRQPICMHDDHPMCQIEIAWV